MKIAKVMIFDMNKIFTETLMILQIVEIWMDENIWNVHEILLYFYQSTQSKQSRSDRDSLFFTICCLSKSTLNSCRGLVLF